MAESPPPTPASPAPVSGEPHASRALALLLGAIGIAAATLLWHGIIPLIPADPGWPSMATRLGAASVALLPTAAALWLMIVAQMGGRMLAGAIDPVRQPDTHFLRTNQRAISNTVEQMLVFAPALLALSAGAPATAMPQVVALALTFAAARIIFWLGYLARPLLRAPGMAATFATTSITLGSAIWVWLT